MKFGTQDQAFFPRDILEKFRFIKDCGFEEYEIDGKLLIENIDTVKQAIKETGIPVVTACNGYDGWIGDFIERNRYPSSLGNVHLSITADGFTPKQRRRL